MKTHVSRETWVFPERNLHRRAVEGMAAHVVCDYSCEPHLKVTLEVSPRMDLKQVHCPLRLLLGVGSVSQADARTRIKHAGRIEPLWRNVTRAHERWGTGSSQSYPQPVGVDVEQAGVFRTEVLMPLYPKT